MQYLELQTYLSQITDEVTADVFDRSAVVFEQLGIDDWLDSFDRIIGLTSTYGDDIVLDSLQLNLRRMHAQLLAQQGIVLLDTALLSEVLCVLEALSRVNNEAVRAQVMEILDAEGSDAELLAELVEFFSGQPTTKTLPIIDQLSEGAIERLRYQLQQIEEVQVQDQDPIDLKRLAQYQKFRVVFAGRTAYCDQYAPHPQAIGLPFSVYADAYAASQLKRDINTEDKTLGQVCITLIGLGCLSHEGPGPLAELVKPYLEKTTSDLSQLTQIFVNFNKLLQEYSSAQT